MIKSTLNWLDLISTEKTSQTVTINKDNCAFSVVYSLLKIKSKAYIFENIFTILKWQNKSCWQKSAEVIQWFCFSHRQLCWHLPNADVNQKDWCKIKMKFNTKSPELLTLYLTNTRTCKTVWLLLALNF